MIVPWGELESVRPAVGVTGGASVTTVWTPTGMGWCALTHVRTVYGEGRVCIVKNRVQLGIVQTKFVDGSCEDLLGG